MDWQRYVGMPFLISIEIAVDCIKLELPGTSSLQKLHQHVSLVLVAGYLVGFILTLSNLCFFAALLTFFVLGSKATKFRSQQKKKFEEDFKEGMKITFLYNIQQTTYFFYCYKCVSAVLRKLCSFLHSLCWGLS